MVRLLDTWQCPTQSVLYVRKLAHEKVWENGKVEESFIDPRKSRVCMLMMMAIHKVAREREMHACMVWLSRVEQRNISLCV